MQEEITSRDALIFLIRLHWINITGIDPLSLSLTQSLLIIAAGSFLFLMPGAGALPCKV